MSRPRSRLAALFAAVLSAYVAAATASCALVSFERLSIATMPSKDGELAPAEGPLRVSFSIDPVHESAERAFSLSSSAGSSGGDFRWSGASFDFYPVPPLKKGCRWTLSIEGTIEARDGRRFDAATYVRFFAGTRAGPVALVSFAPANGATVSTTDALAFVFSRAVDSSLFSRNFSLSPSTEYALAWSGDGRAATVVPKPRWAALTAYSWQIKADLADAEGVGLAKAYDGAFLVQGEGRAPRVVTARPAVFANGAFAPLSAGLDELGWRDAIYLTFSEEVTRESVADALKLTPAVRGRVLQDGPTAFGFLPEEGYAARTEYKLQLLSSVATPAGCRMSEDYLAWFTPKVADLGLSRAFVDDSPAITVFGDGASYAFVPDPIDKAALIVLEFGSPVIDAAQRDRTVTLVSCASLFPAGLSPALRSAQWVGDSRLELSYAGFTASSAASTYYYKVLVPGGPAGISDGAGGSMEKDQWFVIHT